MSTGVRLKTTLQYEWINSKLWVVFNVSTCCKPRWDESALKRHILLLTVDNLQLDPLKPNKALYEIACLSFQILTGTHTQDATETKGVHYYIR